MERGRASKFRQGPAGRKSLIVVLKVGPRLIEATSSAPCSQSKKSLIVVLKVGPRLIKAIGGRGSNRPRTTTNLVTAKKSLIVKLPIGARMADVEAAMDFTSEADIDAAANRLPAVVEMSDDEIGQIDEGD